jgi:16S rRNA (cytosine1402-N4)-methyltransferase
MGRIQLLNSFCTLDTNQPKNTAIGHEPVLIEEVCGNLDLKSKRVVVDCTLGLGGHAKVMLEKMPAGGRLFAFELDPQNMKRAKQKLRSCKDKITFINANFSTLQEQFGKTRLKGVDAVLFDLGLSSVHTDDPEKGFSFLREGPLDMRFDHKQTLTAEEVVNKYSEKELIRIFKEYGEEKKARKIAMEIVRIRKRKPFKTTTQLADMIEKLLKRQGRIHPATRVFQAIRIEVNKELENLRKALEQAVELLRPKGRIAVISYHSLEDRIVKRFFRDLCRDYVNLPGEMTTTILDPKLLIVTKKPIVPGPKEVAGNPRSRSAKLRVAEKL